MSKPITKPNLTNANIRIAKRDARTIAKAKAVGLNLMAQPAAPHVEKAFAIEATTIYGVSKRQHSTNLKPGQERRDPERQAPHTQVAKVMAELRNNLKRIAGLMNSMDGSPADENRLNKAAFLCSLVARERNKLIQLGKNYVEAKAADPVPDVPIHHASKLRVQTKVRRYKMFSDK